MCRRSGTAVHFEKCLFTRDPQSVVAGCSRARGLNDVANLRARPDRAICRKGRERSHKCAIYQRKPVQALGDPQECELLFRTELLKVESATDGVAGRQAG